MTDVVTDPADSWYGDGLPLNDLARIKFAFDSSAKVLVSSNTKVKGVSDQKAHASSLTKVK